MVGAPDSWDHTVSISNNDYEYNCCIWSPCGRFVAAQTTKAVEIRDQLTFELLTTLQPTEPVHPLMGPLAYSPDGRSIACDSCTSIVIWDIQTGGVAREIPCLLKNVSVVWSLNGRKIGFIDIDNRVRTYDLASRTTVSPGNFSSTSNPYFWAHQGSFRILTTVPGGGDRETTVEVLEVGSTLVKVYSHHFTWSIKPQSNLNICYSPTTCRFAISIRRALHMYEDWNPILLPLGGENFSSHCFSSHGSIFAAVTKKTIYIWEYNGRNYVPWKEIHCPGRTDSPLQFSPTHPSILGSFGSILREWRLHQLPATPATGRQRYASLSPSGNYVAAAYKSERTITIINADPLAPSQLIDMYVGVEGLVLTGNILLAFGSGEVVAWLLKGGGLVDGFPGSGKADRTESIWITPSSWQNGSTFSVQGHIGVIAPFGDPASGFTYHTETGEIFRPDQVPQFSSGPWQYLKGLSTGRDYGIHNQSQPNAPSDGDWQIPRITLSEEWASDPAGRRRLWVPVEWRADWDLADWCHDVATQFSILGGKTVVIKF